MTTFETEKATEARDLPHTFDPPDGGKYCRLCGGTAGKALHATETPAEQAAEVATTSLQRELGT